MMTTHQASHRLVLGGARSGKSAFAEAKILQGAPVSGFWPAYVATGQSFDNEMADRVRKHQDQRDSRFLTYECPVDLEATLVEIAPKHDIVLVDCLTLWVSNLMMTDGADVDARGQALIKTIESIETPIIFVSNEVGLGIVPDNAMARQFRDHAGRLHQDLASACAHVTFVAAGLPLALKGEI